MVRHDLKLSSKVFPSVTLKSIFVALDHDGSGAVEAGEFGMFMRLGDPRERQSVTAKGEARRAALLSNALTKAAEVRTYIDSKLHKEFADGMAGVMPMAPEKAEEIGNRVRADLTRLYPEGASSEKKQVA